MTTTKETTDTHDRPGTGTDYATTPNDIEVFYERVANGLNNAFHAIYHNDDCASAAEVADLQGIDDPTEKRRTQIRERLKRRNGQNDVDAIVEATDERFREQISVQLSAQMSDGVLRQIEQQYRARTRAEHLLDQGLTRLRWFAAALFASALPIIIGITFILIGESYQILTKSFGFMMDSFSVTDGNKKDLAELYGIILSMLDMMLISALVMMVTIGGYENTVSRIGLSHAYPRWFGRLDIGQLKIKVAASIATISSIHLLLNFMMIDTDANFDPAVIMWTAIVHVVFVLSAIGLAYMNKASHEDQDAKKHLRMEQRKTKDGDERATLIDTH